MNVRAIEKSTPEVTGRRYSGRAADLLRAFR